MSVLGISRGCTVLILPWEKNWRFEIKKGHGKIFGMKENVPSMGVNSRIIQSLTCLNCTFT